MSTENIIISDISSLRNRVLATILPNTLPGCLNVWVGGDVAGKVLETTTWRWGVGECPLGDCSRGMREITDPVGFVRHVRHHHPRHGYSHHCRLGNRISSTKAGRRRGLGLERAHHRRRAIALEGEDRLDVLAVGPDRSATLDRRRWDVLDHHHAG